MGSPVTSGPGKTILVVEEEEGIRSLLQLALRADFNVLLTANGAEALKLYHSKGAAIDLVLMDVRMQHLDGPSTLAALRQLNERVRCCFMTGDTSSDREQELLALGGLHVFRKPFASLDELVHTLRSFLD